MIKSEYTLSYEGEKIEEEQGAKPQEEERDDTREREIRSKEEGPRQRDVGKGPRAPPRRRNEEENGEKRMFEGKDEKLKARTRRYETGTERKRTRGLDKPRGRNPGDDRRGGGKSEIIEGEKINSR